MRENRLYGSEGGGALRRSPSPYRGYAATASRMRSAAAAWCTRRRRGAWSSPRIPG